MQIDEEVMFVAQQLEAMQQELSDLEDEDGYIMMQGLSDEEEAVEGT